MKVTISALLFSLLLACGPAIPRSNIPVEADLASPDPVATQVPDTIEVRVLLIAYQGAEGANAEQTRTKEQARSRAQLMAEMARSGEPMTTLVPEYSDRPSTDGQLGLYKLRTAAPADAPFDNSVLEAALALPVGGISAPVETPQGFFVIERRKDPPPGPEEMSARHILVAYAGSPQAVGNPTRTEAEARARAEEAATKAKLPNADWNALVAEYTDEPGSDQTGGDLGHFGRGRMVPAFERAAFKLQVGEISDVVQSPFGFHVIQRYE